MTEEILLKGQKIRSNMNTYNEFSKVFSGLYPLRISCEELGFSFVYNPTLDTEVKNIFKEIQPLFKAAYEKEEKEFKLL